MSRPAQTARAIQISKNGAEGGLAIQQIFGFDFKTSLLSFENMYCRKSSMSVEQKHEAVGRVLNQELQSSIASYYSVNQSTISRMLQKYNDDPKLKAKALDAASLFYERNPDNRPNGARSSTLPAAASSTHPAAASRNSDGLTVMRAIQLPPPVTPQQVSRINPSFAVPHGILRGISPAEMNVPGAIRLLPTGQAFTSGASWLAQPVQHQRQALCYGQGTPHVQGHPGIHSSRPAAGSEQPPFVHCMVKETLGVAPPTALSYVQAGQGTLHTCTSQGPSEICRPAATAAEPTFMGEKTVAAQSSATLGDGLVTLISFSSHAGILRPRARPA